MMGIPVLTLFPFCARNIAIRSPLSLDGRKMHYASLVAITESKGRRAAPRRSMVWSNCALRTGRGETETLSFRASGHTPLSFASSHPSLS